MNTYSTDNEQFKNEPTRRFYEYFYPKLREGDIDMDQFFVNMDVGINPLNRMQFFSQMKRGHKGITIQQIVLAWRHYHVLPNYLFGLTEDAHTESENIAAEPSPGYDKSIYRDLDKIRKLLGIIEEKIRK